MSSDDDPDHGERTAGESTGTVEVEEAGSTSDRPDPGPDEVYCMSCGAVIKERAEICPECGVRQEVHTGPDERPESGRSRDDYAITEHRRRELEKVANTSTAGVVLVGFLLSPVAYLMVGRVGLALLNFFTFNYFLFGPFLVPLHCLKIVRDAERELRRAGVEGY